MHWPVQIEIGLVTMEMASSVNDGVTMPGLVSWNERVLAESRQRCFDRFRLDRRSAPRPVSLSGYELKAHSEPFEDTLPIIEEEIRQIAEPLAAASFSISFADLAGLILYYHGDGSDPYTEEFERAGTFWAEGIAGTNGVGTCLMARSPVLVFKEQHFFPDHAHLSCCSAPVKTPDNEMLGVLNFTSADPDLQPDVFRLTTGLLIKFADRMSNRLFQHHFRNSSLLTAFEGAETLLLAVDEDDNLIGGNAGARRWLGLPNGSLRPRSLWETFDREAAETGRANRLRLRGGSKDTEFTVSGEQYKRKVASASGPLKNSKTRTVTSANARASKALSAKRTSAGPSVDECLGQDPRMIAHKRVLHKVAGSRLPILLLGETGVGKDTLACALHREGDRHDKPFVAFNCAAVPESLIDSELFGYATGAFTGAKRDGNPGRLVEADGGTLFLDEIGDMPLSLQTRLLRVLETGEVMPLGSGQVRRVDMQVIAATNNDVKRRVAEGSFRSDLYHRLAAVVVNLPPLRERTDLRTIIRNVFDTISHGTDRHLSESAMNALANYGWPGNIRELKYVLQRAVLVSDGPLVAEGDLALDDKAYMAISIPALDCPTIPVLGTDSMWTATCEAEKQAIEQVLAATGGDIRQSVAALKISRATLYRKMRQYGLSTRRNAAPLV